MLNNEVFEVTRADYKSFIERLVKGVIFTKEETIDENTCQMNVFSKKTNKLLCARKYSKIKDAKEKYYIFEYPDSDEWIDAIPKVKITLETKEEVQAVLEAFKKMREEQNDRTV